MRRIQPQKGEPKHTDLADLETKEPSTQLGKYLRLKKVFSGQGVSEYAGVSTTTAETVRWIEIEGVEAEKEGYVARLEAVQQHQKDSIPILPRILHWTVQGSSVLLVTEARAEQSLLSFLEGLILNEALIRQISTQLLSVCAWLEKKECCTPISIETARIDCLGRVYLHSPSLWKEFLGLELAETEKQSSAERIRHLGLCLLALGGGKISPSILLSSQLSTLSEPDQDKLQRAIIEQIEHIPVPCFKEVVLLALSAPYTSSLIEEIQALHFFYPESKSLDLCACGRGSELGIPDGEEYEPVLNNPGRGPNSESIYDHEAGVAVKASTLDKDMFSFQMHFFRSCKRVSFCFNKREDTVESVIREMEDEGLAEEEQVDLIKAHMENLIEKIEEKEEEEKKKEEESKEKEEKKKEKKEEKKEEEKEKKKEIKESKESKESKEKKKNGNRSKESSPENSVHSSEDSIEYPTTECKDIQPVYDFALEVATLVKRTKSTAESWNNLLKRQDVRTVGDLRMLVEEDWEMLELPVFASRAMKNVLFGESYRPFREKMLGVDDSLKEYEHASPVEELLMDTAERHARPELFSDWVQKVKCQDIRTVGELKLLREEDWEHLELSVFSYRVIRNAVFRQSKCLDQRVLRKEDSGPAI
ncbi:WNK lysine deficient protein kinase [Nematocida homosporus]|uniref:WNK lysine deficient protein kinase n=1 Tax=Nematocida homosporus TaxID=1912981 RepID=UPI00221EF2CE|nr:WNK lysine deficient protein kinase [Nematocida homosporus]KAI5185251.1 WNK lysine deficient protein kinase [Nematocida homosporus]